MFLFITAKPNDLESRNLSHWIRHSQFTLVLLKTNEKMFLSMIFPLLCFSPDLDTFFCLFTSKKGHSYEKNSDSQFHRILQTTRDSREEKKIFHVVQLKSYFFFVHPLFCTILGAVIGPSGAATPLIISSPHTPI